TPTVQELLTVNNARMDQQEEHLLNTGRAAQALVAQVSELTSQLQHLRSLAAPPTPPSPPPLTNTEHLPEPRLPTPELYAGEPKLCRAFLTKCSMFFSLQPRTFATESSKVALVLTLLSRRAALWGTAVWENQHPCCSSFLALSEEMVVGREAARMLTDLRQGNRSVSDYSIEFRTLAAECRWNEQAQWDVFLHGLADRIQREIFTLDLPSDLDGLIDGLCIYCGAAGHFLLNCPVKGTARQLQWAGAFHNCLALVDSGVEGNFMDFDFAHRLHIPVVPLTHKITVNALNGQALPDITHTTGPVTLITSGNHLESITLLLTPSPLAPIVLGHPWLVQHNPRVDWGHNSVSAWSDSCYASCLVSACLSVSCSLLQNESVNLSNVPEEYRDLKEVFSKSRAASPPPHRPYDCAIDLVPGTSLPKGKLYSLSAPEREAMEKYISDSLAAG
ncbi:hypothetical protein M9458_054741, partial [Cirrhinus mrigala]